MVRCSPRAASFTCLYSLLTVVALVPAASALPRPLPMPVQTEDSAAAPGDNPFFAPSPLPFGAPDFSRIQNEHFLPAFRAGMEQQLQQVEAIANDAAAPDFANTIEALERSGEILTRVSDVFFNLTSAHTNPGIQKIQTEVAPLLAAHSDNIHLNPTLFQRVQTLYDNREQLGLSAEQDRCLEKTRERFIRAGAQLGAEQQKRIRAINERMSELSTRFEDNLLAITRERTVVVEKAEELEGMSAADVAAAAELATARNLPGKYLLPITNTTRQPVLAALKNRELRRRVWEASAFRGLGRDGGIDNRPLVLELARLRAEKAALLGFDSHAHYALDNQMAREPAAALKMLADLVPGVAARLAAETTEIRSAMTADGITDEVQPWDWEYYAEKVRLAKYDVDENLIKPYFELDSVLKNGVFFTMNRLFGVRFVERTDLPVYHPDVRVFDVLEADGTPIGLFYADYFARESKRGGAWMSSFVDQSGLLQRRPVIVNVMNIPKPAAGEPALISFDHAQTMFHEMGHAVHGLFSDVRFPSLAGTNVPRDFVEFPSTFQEDWAIHPEVLGNYARHYQTGEPLPAALLEKVLAARRFNQGFDTMEYVSAALLDLAWHSLNADQVPPADQPEAVENFEAEVLEANGVRFAAVPPRYRTAYFAHVWPGGYSASYYAYLWSEVLAADAFEHVQTASGLSRNSGDLFRKEILSRGGSAEPMQLYRNFAGDEPGVNALLIRRGLESPPKNN